MSEDEPSFSVVSRKNLKISTFIDLATSTSSRADYTVIATVGADKDQNVFILNILRGRWEWPDAREYIIDELLEQEVRLSGVETNGFQLSSFQELIREKRLKHIAFYPVQVSSDKLSRSLLVSARASNRKLFYARGASWAEYMITEFVNFPAFRHDDVVDAVCGAVELLNRFEPAASSKARPGVVRKTSRWRRN
jgi:predicted phage terminase large subunit-like protein